MNDIPPSDIDESGALPSLDAPVAGNPQPANAGGSLIPLGSRRRLSNRRLHLGEAIDWKGQLWELRVGTDDRLCVREVFCTSAAKSHVNVTSELQAMVDDFCVALSRCLQHGDSIADAALSLGRESTDIHAPFASIFGLIVAIAARIELELQPLKAA